MAVGTKQLGAAEKRGGPMQLGAAVAALCYAAPVSADPGELAVTFLCKYMPVVLILDHVIDLMHSPATINGTAVQQLPAANPNAVQGAPTGS